MKGFLTLEILLALCVFSFLFSASLLLYGQLSLSSQNMAGSEMLLNVLNNELEQVYLETRNNFSTIQSATTTSEMYTLTRTITFVDNLAKEIKVKAALVSNPRIYVENSSRWYDWRNAAETTPCYFEGDFTRASLSGKIDLGASTTATDLVVKGSYVFMSADSSVQNKDDLFVIDVREVNNPVVVASLNTGPGVRTLAVVGDYAYLGNSSINSQLQIVSIKDPLHPVLVSSYKLPGIYNDGTTIANALIYSRGTIYLGTKKSMIAELHVIDVSNVFLPVEIGSYEMDTAINGLMISDGYLFVANPSNEEVKVLDVRTRPIVQVGGFDAPGNSASGRSFFALGTTTYLGRTFGNDEFFVLNTSSTTHPISSGSFKVNATINDLIVAQKIALLATSATDKEVQAISLDDTLHLTEVRSFNLPAKAVALGCDARAVYVGIESSDALRIITSP